MTPFYRFIKILATILIKPFYPLKVIGKENLKRGGGLVVCNHFRMLDIILVGLYSKEQIVFVGKKELFKNRFVRWFFYKMGAIAIDREHSDVKAMMEIMKRLKENKRVCIFPEGTRNKKDDELQDVKSGAALFAIKTKKPVYPMMFFTRSKFLRKNYLIAGESYEYTDFYGKKLSPEDIDAAGKIMHDKMYALHEELRNIVQSKRKKSKCKS